MNAPVLLEVQGLRRDDIQGKPLLRDVSFQLRAGERWSVQGRSGAGKSLFLRSLVGLDPGEGTRWLRGQKVLATAIPAFRAQVVYVAQAASFAYGTVEAALREPFTWRVNKQRKYHRDLAVGWLTKLGRSAEFLEKQTGDLSGGEASLAAIVRALLLEPAVLLLDEPTSAMDHETATRLEDEMLRWVATPPRAYVWVTHHSEQVERIADHHIVFEQGRMLPPS